MSKHRKGHRNKPKTPLHKRNGAKLKDDRLEGSNRSQQVGANTEEDTPRDTSSWGKGGVLKNIENPSETAKDLSLIQRALKNRWGLSDGKKAIIQKRLMSVLEKQEVAVPSKEGPVTLEEPADRNAVAAARVLVQMEGQDIERDQFEVKQGTPPTPGTVVTVNQINNVDNRRIELARLAEKLGARSLSLNGEEVPVTDLIGTTLSVSETETSS